MDDWFKTWSFRTNTPVFNEGEQIVLYAGTFNEQDQVLRARVGDTQLEVSGGGPGLVDQKIKVRVTSFDSTTFRGQAKLVEVRSESGF